MPFTFDILLRPWFILLKQTHKIILTFVTHYVVLSWKYFFNLVSIITTLGCSFNILVNICNKFFCQVSFSNLSIEKSHNQMPNIFLVIKFNNNNNTSLKHWIHLTSFLFYSERFGQAMTDGLMSNEVTITWDPCSWEWRENPC